MSAFDFVSAIVYDIVLWFFNIVVHTFFRDIKSRGGFNIPKNGPVIFVIAPHHNQFVDAVMVMSTVRELCGRRSSLLIANVSYQQKFVGTCAKMFGAIPVERAQDLLKPGKGQIFVDEQDNTRIIGKGTEFTKEAMVRGLIGLPRLGNAQILSIEDDTHLVLKKPFKSANPQHQDKIEKILSNGTSYKVAPHIDNNQVFHNVFNHLNSGKVLGIFPEGGSHDRPDLLPLKPGVAIMALGAVASQLEVTDEITPVKVIPVGLNYFHPHKFRSRVVIEFGKTIEVDAEMARAYNENSHKMVSKLLDTITLSLKEVTVTCDDYDTLMALQAARRLYTSAQRDNIPLPLVVEMNRRLVKGYTKYASEPEVVDLKNTVAEYNRKLHSLGIHDHQVEHLDTINRFMTFCRFVKVFAKCAVFTALSMPGIILFSPVFIIAKRISKKKAEKALAASSVKLKAKDVLSTWKIIVALAIAPCLYVFYSVLGTIFIKRNFVANTNGFFRTTGIFAICYAWAVFTTYASLRVGELGVDQYKALSPLFISMLSHHSQAIQIRKLKETRRDLTVRINHFCDKYGPEMFEDYEKFYREYNGELESDYVDVANDARSVSSMSLHDSPSSYNLSNLADIQIFSKAEDSSDEDDDGSVEMEDIGVRVSASGLRNRKA